MELATNPRAVNLRQFKKQVIERKRTLKRFLTKLENERPRGIDKITPVIEQEVWSEVDCLTCANCCKKMSPTFTKQDLIRISAHLHMTVDAFKEKWLFFDKKDKDWMNVKQPCQFLDLKTNMCSIYEVRPADCAGFPHLSKKKAVDYMHVHKQNIEYCPATFKMVEKLKAAISLVQLSRVR
ncbi:YkgJ family cysteine cluster protein [Flavihumibacter cheonanensis]|jgi:Fe-S-cluster containining protein|uniref:YkgJ family cysteine cluster protein n=1 Tax=Flavihumibacter cheonanensis TaxID=1442385 RepID=UPI001EF860C1|nr:YkgJ family cysteine cluster protein [Flavihumibacter cheonanensis]MCG7752329.1 YkgJ family cysteine cluster protein [Flavihumibacter cheonanensis]